MLEKRNQMQRRKLMHCTYKFTPRPITSASTQRPKSLLNQECASASTWYTVAYPMRDKLSRNISICFPMYRYLHECCILVPSLYALFWTCYTYTWIHSNLGRMCSCLHIFCIFPWQMDLWCLHFSLQSHFYPLPFFVWTGVVSKWWTFSISGTFQIIFLPPIG